MVESEGRGLVRKILSVVEKLLFFPASEWGDVSVQIFWEENSKIAGQEI